MMNIVSFLVVHLPPNTYISFKHLATVTQEQRHISLLSTLQTCQ